ncbi:AMP-binding protein [Rhizorhabdus sp.]|uniref:class I adenylate-forming enzyme family protein n=1 Tax=Rhizorhabdus sp. TaxID=1968843 RepID=UPI00199950FF|nr:AMP-binding protein [Rhizorhabdus sp.]MBD3759610.1 AMP-binding protein [Rhizorhabdus sp.]
MIRDFLDEHGLIGNSTDAEALGMSPTVAAMLDRPLTSSPDRIAVVDRHRRISYRDLDREVNAAAGFLASLNVRPGDRIAATAVNSVELVTAFLAAQRIGAVWVGINRNYAPAEKRYFLEDSGASLYLADRGSQEQVADGEVRTILMEPGDGRTEWSQGLVRHADARHPAMPVDPWAPAGIAYTSGTTGRPKGAVHSQHNMMVAAFMAQVMAKDRVDEIVRGMTSPMTILNMMILGTIATLSKGDRLICLDRTDARGVADWIRDERITTTTLVPTIVHDLLTRSDIDAKDLESLDWLVVGGAMVPEGLRSLYEQRFGARLTTGYGQTEQPTAIARTHDGTPLVQGAIGRPLPHLHVAILDEEDRPVPLGDAGEICVRAAEAGPYAGIYTPTLGYWDRPEQTAKLLRNGWLHTGDIGHMDGAGDLYIHDRRSDLILRGGANVYPAEVERILRQDARVIDCAVFGLPDERLGQSVAAVVETFEPDEAALLASVEALCADQLARYKTPVNWRFVSALPRNTMGKVMKLELAALFKG